MDVSLARLLLTLLFAFCSPQAGLIAHVPRCFHAILERQVFIQHALADVLAIGVLVAAAIAKVFRASDISPVSVTILLSDG